MTTRKLVLHRRALLRGVLGGVVVGLGLPVLEAMLDPHGTRLASGDPIPRRFMTWVIGNGVRLDRWVPATEGADYELTPALAPLADVREYCSVVSGLVNPVGLVGPCSHHNGYAGVFSGYPDLEIPPQAGSLLATKLGGPSIDQVVAAAIGSATTVSSVQAAVSRFVVKEEGPTLQFLSHKGPDEPLPPEYEPKALFNQLFGGFSPPEDPTVPPRLRMVDAVRGDAKRLMARVGAADRHRLEAHLEAVAALEKKIKALPPLCAFPDEPTIENALQDGAEPLEAVSNAMADILAHAFACDITRVASFAQSAPKGGTVFSMTGTTAGIHVLTHTNTPEAQDLVHDTVVFNMKCFAYLLESMRALPEGPGNVLDNTCILFGSDCAEGLVHSQYDMPMIVAGGGGGALVHPGIHYRSPDPENPETTSDLLLACLKTVVPDATEVGGDEGLSTTPLAAIASG